MAWEGKDPGNIALFHYDFSLRHFLCRRLAKKDMKCRSWCSAIFETSCTRYTTLPKGTHQSSTSVQPTSKVPKPQSDKLPILLEIHNMFARRRRGEEPLLKNTTFSLKVCFLLRSSFLNRIEDGMRHERGPCVSNGKGIHDWEDIVLIDKSEMGLSSDIFIRKCWGQFQKIVWI